MVHSVEMTQKQLIINYDYKVFKNILIMICIPNHLLANTLYFQEGLDLLIVKI